MGNHKGCPYKRRFRVSISKVCGKKIMTQEQSEEVVQIDSELIDKLSLLNTHLHEFNLKLEKKVDKSRGELFQILENIKASQEESMKYDNISHSFSELNSKHMMNQ
jgi:hypothetical protein